jgi:hypothetical protein
MKQIAIEEQWLEFLRLFVRPLVENTFTGYMSDVGFRGTALDNDHNA